MSVFVIRVNCHSALLFQLICAVGLHKFADTSLHSSLPATSFPPSPHCLNRAAPSHVANSHQGIIPHENFLSFYPKVYICIYVYIYSIWIAVLLYNMWLLLSWLQELEQHCCRTWNFSFTIAWNRRGRFLGALSSFKLKLLEMYLFLAVSSSCQ